MKLCSFTQVDILTKNIDFDIFIASTGYESRASFLARQNIQSKEKFVLAFRDNHTNKNRVKNDKFFREENFKFIDMSGSQNEKIFDLLNSSIANNPQEKISILIDYSSMTRVWYGAIISYLSGCALKNKSIYAYFSYSVSEFNEPLSKESETFHFYPIDSFCHLTVPTKPTALIAGLGYEKKRVFGLREYFDAEALYLFYTDDNPFTQYVRNKNREVIDSVDSKNIFPYLLNDLTYTKMLLQDLYDHLKDNFRIIIAPCGPKPFTLLSFIIASEAPNIDVWRISASDTDEHIVEKKESGEIITVELVYGE